MAQARCEPAELSAAPGPRPDHRGAAALRLRILGPLEAWRGGVALELGPARQRAVLGLLALHPNTTLHRDTIIDAIWGDFPPATAVTMVQSYVGRLRRLLDPGRPARAREGLLVSDYTNYRLRMDGEQLDLVDFGLRTGEGRQARLSGDLARSCDRYAAALGLWRAEPLADIGVLRTHPALLGVAQQQAAVTLEYAEVAISAGLQERVLPDLRAVAGREPLNELAHARLMVALAGSGHQAAALRVYDDLRRRLDEQLGVDPGADLLAAHARVLRGEIPRTGRRVSVRAAAAPAALPLVPRQLPAAARQFAGRSAELAALTGLLDEVAKQAGTVVISAISGTAGVGKTALAVHWAHQVAGRFPDGQLYVNLRAFDPSGSPVEPAEAIRGFLDALAVPPERVPAGLDARAALYRSLLAGRRVLVLLDNARDARQVRPLLPGSSGCLVVVTSRRKLTSLGTAEGARPLLLDVLSHREARELLARSLGAERLAREEDAVAELIRLCARLPLALRVVAARAAGLPKLPLAALAGELRDLTGRLNALGAEDPVTDVRAVLSWSFRHLGAPAAQMFRLLGLHPGPDISLPAAASLAGIPSGEATVPLAELARSHLLTEHAPGRFGFHDLLRAYAAELAAGAEPDGERANAVRRLLCWYLHTADAADRVLMPARTRAPLGPVPPRCVPLSFGTYEQALTWCDAEQANLLAAVRLAGLTGHDDIASRLPGAMWQFLKLRRPAADWAACARAGIEASRRIGDARGEASMLNALGSACYRLRKLDDAVGFYREALRLRREIGDRQAVGATLNNLGMSYSYLGLFDSVLDCFGKAVAIARETADRHGECIALDNLGEAYRKLRRFDDALGCHRQSLAIARETGDRQGEGFAWHNLGEIHRLLRRPAAAREYYQQALAVRRQAGDRHGEAQTLRDLGNLLDETGHAAAAHRSWQDALAILGELDHPDADDVRAKLGRVRAGAMWR